MANCVLTFPLTFRAVFDALKFNEAWVDYWFSNQVKVALYNLIIITFATYLPMVLQMASLVFGIMRQRAGKLEVSKKKEDSKKSKRSSKALAESNEQVPEY